jgi:hypothetical protein
MNAELLINTRESSNEYMFATQTFEFEFQCNSMEQRIILSVIKKNIEKGIKLTQLKIAELSGCSVRAVATVFKKLKIFIGCSWKRLSYRNLYEAIKILIKENCKISEQRTHQQKDEFFGMRKCYVPFNESDLSIMRGSNMNDDYSYYTDNNNINSCKNFKQTVDNSNSVQSFPPQTWTTISSNFIPNEENMKRMQSKENVDTDAIINNFIRYNRRRGSKSMDWNLSFKGWLDNSLSWRTKDKSAKNEEKVTKAQGFTNHINEAHPTYHDKTGISRIERERSSEYRVTKFGSSNLEKIRNLLTGRGRQQNE